MNATRHLERRTSIQELVRQDAQSPMVNAFGVFLSFNHFWWKIIQSSAHCLPSVSRGVDTPAKVSNLEFPVYTEEQVLGLDIAMDNVLAMEVHQRVGHLVDVARAPLLTELAELAQLSVKLSLAGELEHEEDTLLIMEVAVEAEDVGVAQVLLNFDFTPSLFLDAVLDYFRLVEGFEGDDVVGFGLCPNHVDTTEFAFAQWSAHVKAVKVPFARWVLPNERSMMVRYSLLQVLT